MLIKKLTKNAETFCNNKNNTKLCKALIKEELKIIKLFDQFPEAMCDMATAIVFKKKFAGRLSWRAGKVKENNRKINHFWIVDQKTKLNIDLTAFQFDHIDSMLCKINDITFQSCPFLIGTDNDFKKLGYEWFSQSELQKMLRVCPIKILEEARNNYKIKKYEL